MKPGTIVKVSDGRIGTVVYHGLDGYGVKWGRLQVPVDELLNGTASDDWAPDALLRESYKTADYECVGNDYEIEP